MTILYKLFKYNLIFIAMVVMVVVLSVAGCGKKGPPSPPRQLAVPSVNNLESKIEANNVILTWTVPEAKEKESPPITGFVIRQAKYPLSEEICENCPINYKPIAEVAADFNGNDRKIKYIKQLDKGFKYFFKVTAFSKNMTSESRDSNIIKFDY
ncbi:MAG: fibronectin type III domain-containing protein [Desulfobacterales bacterium]